MLKHPWIIEQQAQKANMEKWIAQVWGWEIPVTSSSSHHKRRKDKKKHNSLNGGILSGNGRSAGGSAGSGSGDHRALTHGSAGGSGFEGSSGGSLLSPDSPRPPF